MSALRHGLFFCLILVTGCGAAEPRWASDAAIAKHTYRPASGPELRLHTVISTRNGSGAHSGLLITTSRERILFDPAGTFSLPQAPERNDVHHGITPRVLSVYIDYHARRSFDVIEQRVPVMAEQAAHIAALAKAHGAVPNAQCTLAITRILKQVPGFEVIPTTYFPKTANLHFAMLSGVETRVFSDQDTDQNQAVLADAALP